MAGMKKPQRREKELPGLPGQRRLELEFMPAAAADLEQDYWRLQLVYEGIPLVRWLYKSANAARVSFDTWADKGQPEGWNVVQWGPFP